MPRHGGNGRTGRQRGQLAIVQVGVGCWGRSWAQLVTGARGFRLAAAVDLDGESRLWASATFGVPVFERLERTLLTLSADVVLVASPPATHWRLAEDALAAGCHVIVEKPVAMTLSEARGIAEAAERHGRRVMVAQNYRFRRQPAALRELVQTGVLGRLIGVRIECRRDLRNSSVSRHDWRGRMAHPYLFEMAIHHVDLVRGILGQEVAEVDARSWAAPDAPFRHDPTVEAILTLEDGTPIAYSGSWASPAKPTSWNGDWEIVGTLGRATWTGGVGNALRGIVAVEEYGQRVYGALLPELPALDRAGVLREARRAIEGGVEPECSVTDNLRSLATVLALARSTEERRPVPVDEVLAG